MAEEISYGVCAGFSFVFADGSDGDHLHFVATKPSEPQIVVLNFTTARKWSDLSCVIEPGEHPQVTKRTCVAWTFAKVTTLPTIHACLHHADIYPREPLSVNVLQKVWNGVQVTRNLADDVKQVFIDQGLIGNY